MLAILSGLVKLLDWHDERLDTKCANLMHKDVLFEKNPEKEQLLAITRNKLFKQTSENFQKAVQTKLATYDLVPTAIEKTMSEVQLFESNSPFWATDLTIAQIHDVLEAHKELIQQGYSDFMEYLLTEVRNPNYDIHYVGQNETALTYFYKLFNSL